MFLRSKDFGSLEIGVREALELCSGMLELILWHGNDPMFTLDQATPEAVLTAYRNVVAFYSTFEDGQWKHWFKIDEEDGRITLTGRDFLPEWRVFAVSWSPNNAAGEGWGFSIRQMIVIDEWEDEGDRIFEEVLDDRFLKEADKLGWQGIVGALLVA
jgi:hypothetical protein